MLPQTISAFLRRSNEPPHREEALAGAQAYDRRSPGKRARRCAAFWLPLLARCGRLLGDRCGERSSHAPATAFHATRARRRHRAYLSGALLLSCSERASPSAAVRRSRGTTSRRQAKCRRSSCYSREAVLRSSSRRLLAWMGVRASPAQCRPTPMFRPHPATCGSGRAQKGTSCSRFSSCSRLWHGPQTASRSPGARRTCART